MAGWYSLPAELRLPILDHLIVTSHRVARFATVCREWQRPIEEATFGSLRVLPQDLDFFEVTVRGDRRGWLKTLWFQVELPPYGQSHDRVSETEAEQQANAKAFSQSIHHLFSILSTWTSGHGLHLDLEVRSPNDKLKGDAGVTWLGDSRYYAIFLGFDNDQLANLGGLPKVEIITTFSTLRRNWRQLNPQALTVLFEHLPYLNDVRYEPWEPLNRNVTYYRDTVLGSEFRSWPSSLKTLSIFEHDDIFEAGTTDPSDEGSGMFWSVSLARQLATFAIRLERLSIFEIIDGRHFIRAIPGLAQMMPEPKYLYDNLRVLSLTSLAMINITDPPVIWDFLKAAGAAALHFPSLQILELWYALMRGASVFRYILLDPTKAATSFHSTWDLSVTDDVKSIWRDVALKYTEREPDEHVDQRLTEYMGRISFIERELVTRDLVLHRESAEDMRNNGGFRLFLERSSSSSESDEDSEWETESENEDELGN